MTAPTALRIEHTSEAGTLLYGTTKPDLTARRIAKASGFRWFPSVDAWGRPHSRDRAPDLYRITAAANAFRAAGYEVTVDVDAAPRPMEEAEADRADRLSGRADALTAKAQRLNAAADERRAAADTIMSAIPLGQPILVGHHSERRHRRDLERLDSHMGAAVALRREAAAAAHGASTADRHMAMRESPVTVANRIATLEADLRRFERSLTPCATSGRRMKPAAADCEVTCPVCFCDHAVGADLIYPEHGAATGAARVQVEALIAHATEQLRYWHDVRQAQIDAGTATNYSRDTVHVGDEVRVRGSWRTVARVNPKSVSVETGYSWTDTVPYAHIQDVRCTHATAGA